MKFLSWLKNFGWGILVILGTAVLVMLGIERGKSADEKIKNIESGAKKDVEKMDDAGVINYLNRVIASRTQSKR